SRQREMGIVFPPPPHHPPSLPLPSAVVLIVVSAAIVLLGSPLVFRAAVLLVVVVLFLAGAGALAGPSVGRLLISLLGDELGDVQFEGQSLAVVVREGVDPLPHDADAPFRHRHTPPCFLTEDVARGVRSVRKK